MKMGTNGFTVREFQPALNTFVHAVLTDNDRPILIHRM